MGAWCFLVSPCGFSYTRYFKAWMPTHLHAGVFSLLALSWPSLLLRVLLLQTPAFANFSSPPQAWSWVFPGRILPLANRRETQHHIYGWKSLSSHSLATNLKSEIMDVNEIALKMLPAPGDQAALDGSVSQKLIRE